MTEKEIRRLFEETSMKLSDLEFECASVAEEAEEFSNTNAELEQALFVAGQYYKESQKEIHLLMQLCIENGIQIPVEGHFIDINEAAPDDDTQKGDYEVPFEDLDSFTYYG